MIPTYNVPLPQLPMGSTMTMPQLSTYLQAMKTWLQDFVVFANGLAVTDASDLGPVSIIPSVSAANPFSQGTSLATLFVVNAYLDVDGKIKKSDTASSSWALSFDTMADVASVLYSPPGTKVITWTAVNEIGGGAGTGSTTLTFANYTLNSTTITFNDTTFTQNGATFLNGNTTLTTVIAGAWHGTKIDIPYGGTNATTAAGARANLSAAVLGANNDITSLSALSTPITVPQGGTNATTAAGARTNLVAAASGANTDITSLASPALASATATTQAPGDNSTKVATTAFATAAIAAAGAGYATPANIQNQAFVSANETGVADAYVIVLSPVLGAYAKFQEFTFFAVNGNTGASTLDAGPGPKAIKKGVSSALAGGDILAGGLVKVVYDGTNFQLLKSA